MYKLYQYSPSGNCYKVRLLLTQLALPFETIEVDIVRKESRTPEFLQRNPNGRIPVLELPSGEFLWESNAILFYLAIDRPFFPDDRLQKARVMQWMSFEQYSHEPYIATSRYWISILGKVEEYREAIAQKREPGYAALRVMEQHLEQHPFFVGDRYSIADIYLFAYTHVCHEGGFELTSFPAIRSWSGRVQTQPDYLPISVAA